MKQIESLPEIGDAFDRHDGLLVEAVILAGAEELRFSPERLRTYRKDVESKELKTANKRAIKVLGIVDTIGTEDLGRATPGFGTTQKRIALTENLVAAEKDEANQKIERT